jgi:hypothetical protein
MSSLASENSPTEQQQAEDKRNVSAVATTRAAKPPPTSSEKTAVNALLMAAMAMTEMCSGNQPASTPPKNNDGTQDDFFETPPKPHVSKLKSPKRKQSIPGNSGVEAYSEPIRRGSVGTIQESSPSAASEEESPKRDCPDDTPSQHPKVKRSRIGSLKKGPRNLGEEMSDDKPPAAQPYTYANYVAETPDQKTGGGTKDLTPVSARCIDFRRMNVNEQRNGTHPA